MNVRVVVVADPDDSSVPLEPGAVRRLLGSDVDARRLGAAELALQQLGGADGIWLASGPGAAGAGALLAAVRWAREQGVPVLASGDGAQTVLGGLAAAARGATEPPVMTASLANALVPQGWVVHESAPDGEPLVLGATTHPFLVLARFAPLARGDGAPAHPVLPAFVEASRDRARYRECWDADLARSSALAAAEAEPRPYVHQMRGPRHRWWRPLLAALVGLLTFLVVGGLLSGLVWVADLAPATIEELSTDPWGTLYGNLLLAALIPATLLALWVGHRRSPWRVLSVTGRFRWGWATWCTAVVVPLWVLYLALSWVVFDQEVLPRPEQWLGLVVVSVLTTPLQAAGEEIAFRGGLVQSVGSWFRSPVLALVVTTVLSTVAFVAAHGSLDPWIVLELGSLAAFGCYLAWRTGGLEAVVVVHVVNNLLIIVSGALLGGLEESYVDGATTGSPASAGLSVLATGVTTTVLLRLARRRGIAPSGWLTPARG